MNQIDKLFKYFLSFTYIDNQTYMILDVRKQMRITLSIFQRDFSELFICNILDLGFVYCISNLDNLREKLYDTSVLNFPLKMADYILASIAISTFARYIIYVVVIVTIWSVSSCHEIKLVKLVFLQFVVTSPCRKCLWIRLVRYFDEIG